MIDEALMPATREDFAVVIDRLFEFGRVFGLANNTTGAVAFYHAALVDLPTWALVATIDSAIANWKWHNKLPLPADLKEHTPQQWRQIQIARRRLNTHLQCGHFING